MRPDWQPILTGDLVVLRPVRADDWSGMFAAAADPAIWAGHPASNRYEEDAFRAFFDGALVSRAAFTILDKQAGVIVGSSRYDHYDPELRRVEIGWTFLARSAWGGTFNGDVKRLMLDHAFRFVDTVVFTVGETNLRSRRALEKIGGVRRPETFDRQYGGVNVPQLVYEIRKPIISNSAPEHAVRPATKDDLAGVLALYRHLHADDPTLDPADAATAWAALFSSGSVTVFVAGAPDRLVSSCTLAIIPNLSRGARPYAVIENVVTHADHRRAGHGNAVLQAALDHARRAGCYKVMLATGSQREQTLRFYERAGFQRGGKTYFETRF